MLGKVRSRAVPGKAFRKPFFQGQPLPGSWARSVQNHRADWRIDPQLRASADRPAPESVIT